MGSDTTRTYTGPACIIVDYVDSDRNMLNPQYTYDRPSSNSARRRTSSTPSVQPCGIDRQFTLAVGSGGGTPGFNLSNTGLSLQGGSNGLLENGVGQLNFALANTGTAGNRRLGRRHGHPEHFPPPPSAALAASATNNGTLTVTAGAVGGSTAFTLTGTDTDASRTSIERLDHSSAGDGGGCFRPRPIGDLRTDLQGLVAASGIYYNLASYVASGNGCLGTVATILAGTNNSGSATTVTMAWRPRATDEIPGTAGHPPIPGAATGLISDVVKVTGVGSSDLVVLEMTYSLAGGTAAANQAYADGFLYLGEYPDATGSSVWSNPAILADKTAWAPPSRRAAWFPASGAANANDVWVVLPGSSINGNQFAAVPEPGTVALLLAGCFALVPIIRRRMKKS